MELLSRYVFLDTCIYQQKNFQFSSYQLKALKSLIDAGQVTLLMTDVTVREVRSHISLKSREAATAINKLKKEAVILRNFPRLPTYGLFEDVTAEHMELQLFKDFEAFAGGNNVCVVSIEEVSPTKVFDLYFSSSPPFAIGKKSEEFSDAFALEALNEWSVENKKKLHVISVDSDMQRYCATRSNMVHSSSLDDFIEAVNKSYAAAPSEFADKALKFLMPEILNKVEDVAYKMEPLITDFFELITSESLKINSIKAVGSDLMGVDVDVAEYTMVFSLDTQSRIEYEDLNYDVDDYVFGERFLRTANYTVELNVFLVIDIEGFILERTKVVSVDEYSGLLFLEDARNIIIKKIVS
ncbi:PIN domain-containing protein [Pseudomonas syringae]|uniref:DUF4935 domain-containing protein n=1 Tax=Pseudomonas syringae pv. syringae TaxID=321 RepID=A0AAE5SBA1_PSESY|nr:PIN domain-containing protein [Pseudomonas syringae]POQ05501.1 hypothetical protein CXB42_05000 [Pseudomonas syringae pv. syringae]